MRDVIINGIVYEYSDQNFIKLEAAGCIHTHSPAPNKPHEYHLNPNHTFSYDEVLILVAAFD